MKRKKIRILKLIAVLPILVWAVAWFGYGVSLPNTIEEQKENWVNIYIIMSLLMPFMYFMNKIKSKSWLWVLVGIMFIVVSVLFGKIAWVFISVGLCFMWFEFMYVFVRKASKKAEMDYIRGGK